MVSFIIKVPIFFLQYMDICVAIGRVFEIEDNDFYYIGVLADAFCWLFCGSRAFSEDNIIPSEVEMKSKSNKVVSSDLPESNMQDDKVGENVDDTLSDVRVEGCENQCSSILQLSTGLHLFDTMDTCTKDDE